MPKLAFVRDEGASRALGLLFAGLRGSDPLYLGLEVAHELAVLAHAKPALLLLGEALRHLGGHFAGVPEHGVLVEAQERVELRYPVGHLHRDLARRLVLGEVEVHRDDALERFDFTLDEVIFRDADVALQDLALGAFFQVVSPIDGFSASARVETSSAAVLPVTAQWSLFCTVLKKVWVVAACLS